MVSGDQIFFLGVGAEKAGTSWMDRQMARHPDIWTPPHKEIHYFDAVHLNDGPFYRMVKYDAFRSAVKATDWAELETDLDRLATLQWYAKQSLIADLTDDWYRGLFVDAGPEPVRGEVTPAYAALSPEGWQHVRELEPTVKIIFLMREPATRLWSAIRYFASNRPESGLFDSVDRMMRFACRPSNVAKTRYDITIDRLRNAFDEKQLFFAFYEDIFESEASQLVFLADLFSFLGVDPARLDRSEMGRSVNASPPAVMPTELHSFLKAEYASMVDSVEAQIGRVPDRWRA